MAVRGGLSPLSRLILVREILHLARKMSKKRQGISETFGCGNQLLEKTYVPVCYCYVRPTQLNVCTVVYSFCSYASTCI